MSGAGSNAEKDVVELVESPNDTHETVMAYDDTGRVPKYVVAVWAVALIGFAAYMIQFCFPDLAAWGRP
jgi:hypothetical protein